MIWSWGSGRARPLISVPKSPESAYSITIHNLSGPSKWSMYLRGMRYARERGERQAERQTQVTNKIT